MNVVGDHAPHDEVVFLFDQSRRVNGVLSNQLDHTTTAIQAFDRELVVELGHHDVVVFGIDAPIHQQGIALLDACPHHGVAFDFKNVGGFFIANRLLVEVNAFLCVIRCGRRKSSRYVPATNFQHKRAGADRDGLGKRN